MHTIVISPSILWNEKLAKFSNKIEKLVKFTLDQQNFPKFSKRIIDKMIKFVFLKNYIAPW
jgi:hypothetical protein